MKQFKFCVYFVMLILLTSCAPVKNDDTVASFFADTKAKSRANRQIPVAVTDALVPNIYQTLTAKPQSHRGLMNISVHELNARDFFMGLVVDSDVNMVVHPEVSGSISLELKNVTVAQVLDAVQNVYGYDYKKTDIGYIIYPATMQTKTFKVDRLAMRRIGRSNISVLSGQSTGNNQNNQNSPYGTAYGGVPNYNNAYNNSNPNINNPTGNSNNPTSNNQTTTNLSSSAVNTITESDFWQELETALKSIVDIDKNAMVVINRQSGLVVARAKPMQLREIESYLDATQKQIARQVILEAKILEVVLDSSHQDGVNWDIVAKNAALITGYGIPATTAFNTAFNYTINTATKFSASLSTGNFRAVIELLESQGKTRILSSPRIATLNNQTAIIKVGQDEYFITNVTQTTTNNIANSNNTQNVNFSQFFSGIALDVTPQIDDNNAISLHIHPSITRVSSQQKDFTIDGQSNSLPLALNVVRESDSIVKAKDGQIVVLGGLMQENETENKEGIFGLTRIPYLGNLFRMNNGVKEKIELIILLKPTLITDDTDWQNDINSSKQRFEQLEAVPQWKCRHSAPLLSRIGI